MHSPGNNIISEVNEEDAIVSIFVSDLLLRSRVKSAPAPGSMEARSAPRVAQLDKLSAILSERVSADDREGVILCHSGEF